MPILSSPEIEKLEEELLQKKKQLASLKHNLDPVKVEDYLFKNADNNEVKLSELFGEQRYLITIHNMGQGCKFCTMWANGFEGIYRHFADKAGFVLVNHDSLEKQKAFAEKQGWTFPMYNASDSSFTKDLGFKDDKSLWPGVSTFRKNDDGAIELIAQSMFGPGDDFCSVWHFYDLLPEKFDY